GGCRNARVGGQNPINPTLSPFGETDIQIILAASKDALVIGEGGARGGSQADMRAPVQAGHQAPQPGNAAPHKTTAIVNKEKRLVPETPKDAALEAKVREFAQEKIAKAFAVREKLARGKAIKQVKSDLKAALIQEDSPEDLEGKVTGLFEALESEIMRRQ